MSSTQRSNDPSNKKGSIAEGSKVQLNNLKRNRRSRGGFVAFEDDSDGLQTQWSDENGIGVKSEYTVETQPTGADSDDVEQGRRLSFPQPPLQPHSPLHSP